MKKIIALAAGYLAWTVVSSVFSQKTWKERQKDIIESDNKFEILFDTFLEIHKNMYETVKAEIEKDENREVFEAYKKELLEIFETYSSKGQDIVKGFQEKGSVYQKEALSNLKKLYEEKSADIESYKELWVKKVEELKQKLEGFYKETQKEITQVEKNLENNKDSATVTVEKD